MVIERLLLSRASTTLDHLYGLLLTFGLALVHRGRCSLIVRRPRASPYRRAAAAGAAASISASCSCRTTAPGWWSLRSPSASATWLVDREDARSAPTCAPRPKIRAWCSAFGVNVPLLLTLDLWPRRLRLPASPALLAAPIYQVSPLMGVESRHRGVRRGRHRRHGLDPRRDRHRLSCSGLLEGLTKVFYPRGLQHRDLRHHGVVLLVRPAGLFGRTLRWPMRRCRTPAAHRIARARAGADRARHRWRSLVAPFAVLSDLPDEGALLRAVRLRLQSAARLYAACCRSAMRRSSAAPPTSPRMPRRCGACRPKLAHPARRRRRRAARRRHSATSRSAGRASTSR